MKTIHVHLVSDSTGDTVRSVARACLVQFEEVEPVEHFWVLVRSPGQMKRVVEGIAAHPGLVLCTVVDETMRRSLEEACQRYTLSVDEFLNWQAAIDKHGLAGLRTTWIQHYREG